MNLAEIGAKVRQRRAALGLSQGRLARLAGLSRATINQLENGSLVDLGFAKIAALSALLGLRLDANASATPRRALRMASRTASVSYRKRMNAGTLARALASGKLPAALAPHVATLLDEAPLALVVAVVEEASQRTQVPPARIWQHITRWTGELRSPRRAWATVR